MILLLLTSLIFDSFRGDIAFSEQPFTQPTAAHRGESPHRSLYPRALHFGGHLPRHDSHRNIDS